MEGAPSGAISRGSRRASLALGAALVAAFVVPVLFAASVMPYRFWDSLAFGSWSRVMADAGHFVSDGQPSATLHRPLFYVAQGLLWNLFGFHEWLGRWLSALFLVLLLAVAWSVARSLATPACRWLVAVLTVLVTCAVPALAVYGSAGMTDVPVAALTCATAAALLTPSLSRWRAPLVGVAACASVLAKPSALFGLVGLAAALAVAARAAPAIRAHAIASGVALATGTGVALLYDTIEARSHGTSLLDFLSAGNTSFYAEKAAAARWERLLQADWLGAGTRLPVLFGLALAVAHVVRARGRRGRLAALAVALAWSIGGPWLADGSVPAPWSGASVLELVGTLVLVTVLVLAAAGEAPDPLRPWAQAVALVWAAPALVSFVLFRSDELRFLAPVWAPLALLAAAAIARGALVAARLSPRGVAQLVAPATVGAAGLLLLANVPRVDDLGGSGWRSLLDLGRSGWGDRATMENFAYGPLSYAIDEVEREAGATGRVVSSDSRLRYFVPGRLDVFYARSCSRLRGARVFVLLTDEASTDIMTRLNGSTADPLAWLQCTDPPLRLVGEQPGAHAVFTVGEPVRAASPADCGVGSTPGQLSDGVFGADLTYAAARELRERAARVGYEAAVIERTGCDRFRVVVPGVPDDPAAQQSFRDESSGAGFDVEILPPERFPEVPPDVAPATP